jgi:uncharacterized protein (DUF488 family)
MDDKAAPSGRRIFTIGHSNHDEETFVNLLRRHEIEVVADVRSQPYSKHSTQFNADQMQRLLAGAGIRYLFLGQELGGRPAEAELYDAEGRVLYDRVAASASFLEAMDWLEREAQQRRVALMCGEENPLECHRNLLVGRVLAQRGVEVRHIRGDGRLQTSGELERDADPSKSRQQLLFPELKEQPWRSTRSVLPRRQQPNSSEN